MAVSKSATLALLASVTLMGGCSSTDNVGDRAMMGGAIGAGLGAVASAATQGNVFHGAGWGAAAGLIVGVLSD
jgi:hypothetical protein